MKTHNCKNHILYFFDGVRDALDKNDVETTKKTSSSFQGTDVFLNQTIINKSGEHFKVISIEGDDLEHLNIQTNDRKLYKLIVAYECGFLHFDNDDLNKILQKHLEEKKEEEDFLLRKKEEGMQRAIAQLKLERERLANAIDQFRDEYRFLSNFYECPITYDGIKYGSGEAAFQAQKDPDRKKEFVSLNPVAAKKFGKKVKLRPHWEIIKDDIMEEIVRCKFTQNPDLKEKLLGTGDRLLIEGNTWGDTYWGVSKGEGLNHLGKILMKIREELRD